LEYYRLEHRIHIRQLADMSSSRYSVTFSLQSPEAIQGFFYLENWSEFILIAIETPFHCRAPKNKKLFFINVV
jgi:hypothetical protein